MGFLNRRKWKPKREGDNGIKNTGSGGGAGRDGGGSGGDGVVIIRITYRILPVEFLNFTAAFQSEDRSGNLRWTIGKEWENSHFEIERAVNSIKSWKKIGEVEGQGYSEKPVDYTYSITRSIQVTPSKTNESWRVYPNPSNTGSRIQIDLLHPERYNDEKIAISLINQMGGSRSAEANSPEHVSSFISEWLRNSPPGMYVVHIQWDVYSEQIKLLRR